MLAADATALYWLNPVGDAQLIAEHQPGNRRLGVDTAAILVVEPATGSGTRLGKRLIGGSIAGSEME